MSFLKEKFKKAFTKERKDKFQNMNLTKEYIQSNKIDLQIEVPNRKLKGFKKKGLSR